MMGAELGGHILLIEDEPNIAEAIRFLLARDGWAVSLLPTGEGAMAAIAQLRPDLVILDLMLPVQSGLQILTQIRGQEASADVSGPRHLSKAPSARWRAVGADFRATFADAAAAVAQRGAHCYGALGVCLCDLGRADWYGRSSFDQTARG
jgi:CheY-like chemotaxis protein